MPLLHKTLRLFSKVETIYSVWNKFCLYHVRIYTPWVHFCLRKKLVWMPMKCKRRRHQLRTDRQAMNEFSVMQNVSINFYFFQYKRLCSEFQCLDWFGYKFNEASKRFFIMPKVSFFINWLTQLIHLNFGLHSSQNFYFSLEIWNLSMCST